MRPTLAWYGRAVRLPRLQLFEFNDAPWAPPLLRETLIWSLGRAMSWAGVLDGLTKPFSDWLARTGSAEVVELGAGTGESAAAFLAAFERRGVALPRFVLTDLEPRVTAWQAQQRARPTIDFVAQPVDALAPPDGLLRGRACALINTLHHFPPAQARRALLSVCAQASGVFVAEGMVRNPLRFLSMAPAGFAASVLAPLLLPGHRARRAGLTWFTPALAAAGAWDGCVSALRMHAESDLREFVAQLGDSWTWQSGAFTFGRFGLGSYFAGAPRPARSSA